MNEILSGSLVEKINRAKELLHEVRGSSIHIGQLMYEIKQELPPQMVWADVLRDEFDLSESQGSKLMSIYKGFVVEGGMPREALEGIDSEKLYLALKLDGTAEEKIAKAQTLTRRDLREERVDDGHVHNGEFVTIHKCCGLRVDTNGTTP